MQPYDYTLNLQNPLQSFAGGMNIGTAIRQNKENAILAQLKMQEQQSAMQRQEQINAIINQAIRPNANAEDYRALSFFLPKDQFEAAEKGYALKKQEEIDADLADTGEAYAAFASGNTESGIAILKREQEVRKSEGDVEGVALLGQMIKKAEEGDSDPARMFLGFTLSRIPGGDKVIESANKFGEEIRKQKEHGILLQQKQAELDKATSDAEVAAIESKFAEKEKVAELKQKGADLDLTNANVNKVLAETRKLEKEIAVMALELEDQKVHGGLTPKDITEKEIQLNTIVNTRSKNAVEANTYYENIRAGAEMKNGVGDVAIINSFMRQLSPGIVTDSDYKAAVSTGGIMAQLQAIKSKYDANPRKTGNLLTDSQRAQFVAMSKKFLENANRQTEEQLEGIKNIVKNYGLSHENVFGYQEKTEAKKPIETSKRPTEASERGRPVREVDY